MDRSVAPSRIFAFGQFEARVDLGKLLKLGREVSLQDQPFRLLVARLLGTSGEGRVPPGIERSSVA